MTIHKAQTSALALMVLLGVAACGQRELEHGRGLRETRELEPFDAISLRGSARLRVQVGEPAALTIGGDERSVEQLSAQVEDDTLHLRTSRREWVLPGGASRLLIEVTVPHLRSLRLEGGNDVRLSGLTGGATTIDIEGAAHLKAEGRLDALTVRMAGAGHADLRDLVVAAAEVTVDGIGSVHVHATESLDATMNGIGAILYSGAPRSVNTSMNGIGTISRDRQRRSSAHDRHNEPRGTPAEDTAEAPAEDII